MEEPQWDQLIPNVNTQDRQCGSSSKSNRIQTLQFAAIIEPYDRDFQYRHLAFTSYRQQQSGLHVSLSVTYFWMKNVWLPSISWACQCQ
jgi:hypothetical protein